MIQTSFINPFPIPGVSIPDGLVFWHKLEDATQGDEINGTEFYYTNNLSYQSCKFNDGFYADDSNSPSIIMLAHKDGYESLYDLLGTGTPSEFCIEFWVKYTDFDIVDGCADDGASEHRILFSARQGKTDHNSSAFSLIHRSESAYGLRFSVKDTNDFYIINNDTTLDISQNSLVHWAYSYKESGFTTNVQHHIYQDNALKYELGDSSWGGYDFENDQSGENLIAFGKNSFSYDSSSRDCANIVFDNIKIWNYAKTDFSDKDNEGY